MAGGTDGESRKIPEPFLEWATSALRASERAVLGGGLLGQASRDSRSPGRFVISRIGKSGEITQLWLATKSAGREADAQLPTGKQARFRGSFALPPGYGITVKSTVVELCPGWFI